MKQYLVSLDQGTTSSRAIIFDRNQNIISMAQQEFAQHYPKAGYVEHDPMDIYASQISVLRRFSRGYLRHRHHQPAGDYHCLG